MAVDLPVPSVRRGEDHSELGALHRLAPEPMRVVLNWGRRYSLWVFNFGLACCAIEFIASSMSRHDFIRLGVIPFAPGPRQADLMVVSGTVTDKMAPAIFSCNLRMPWSNASGRGGQPGTYTSTGTTWSTPLVTE